MPRATASQWQAAFAPAASPAAADGAAAPAGSIEDSAAPSAEEPQADDSLDYAEGDTQSGLLFVMRRTSDSSHAAFAGDALLGLTVKSMLHVYLSRVTRSSTLKYGSLDELRRARNGSA